MVFIQYIYIYNIGMGVNKYHEYWLTEFSIIHTYMYIYIYMEYGMQIKAKRSYINMVC